MDIEEIKKAKRHMDEQIRMSISMFNEATGLSPSSIDLVNQIGSDGKLGLISLTSTVNIEI